MRDTVSKWLGRRPTWQFALIWGLAIAAGCVLGGILGQLWKHHFDWVELLGMAAGGVIGDRSPLQRFAGTNERALS